MSTSPAEDADSGRIEAARSIWRDALDIPAGADHPALAYTWFEPGRTRSPVLNQTTKKFYWAQVLRDHRRYPVLDNKRLMAITHPMTEKKNRRTVMAKRMATLERLHEAGEINIVREPSGLRILPPKDYGRVPDEDDED